MTAGGAGAESGPRAAVRGKRGMRGVIGRQSVAVVGAGWAGCAAALTLQTQGYGISLFEAARQPGGRARRVSINGKNLDNGQHILLGAYTETLRLLKLAGTEERQALLRLPLQMIYPPQADGMHLVASSMPAPLHLAIGLLRARGLSREDKMCLARFSSAARWMGWRMHQDCSVIELLQRFGQSERICHLMWHPLCVAALNTRPEKASAQIFLNVLRDSLGAGRAASDMLIPKADLGSLFPEAAVRKLAASGAHILTGQAVTAIRNNGDDWQLTTAQSCEAPGSFNGVIVATDIANAKRLLNSTGLDASFPEHGYEAITTSYLQYDPGLRLPHPATALVEDAEKSWFGQFVFDRSQLSAHPGLLAVVISSPLAECPSDHAELAALLSRQLAQQFGQPELASPLDHQVITEKRATYSCVANVQRPDNACSLHGLWLAGDYTLCDYPATLEAAVRSGVAAARLAHEALR